jgi:tetratricopeptide (TPR) repeat protein
MINSYKANQKISKGKKTKLIFLKSIAITLFLNQSALAIGVSEFLNNTSNIMKLSSEIVISFIIIIIGVIFFIVIGMIFYWIFRDKSLVILPFEVINSDEKYNGKAISESIVSEFNRIRQIHGSPEPPVIDLISDARRGFSLPLGQVKVDLKNAISSGPMNLGSGIIGVGSSSISIQEILILLKRKCSVRTRAPIISGTLQNCNNQSSNLIVTLEVPSGPKTLGIEWHGSSSLRDLAYYISFELNKECIHAKTWKGFKHITEAFSSYKLYILSDDKNDLNHAKDECLNFLKSEPENTLPFGLIYNLGIAYLNKSIFKNAEILLLKSVELKRNDYNALNMLGIALDKSSKVEAALEYFDRAIDIDSANVSAYINKGWSLHHLGRYEESIKCYARAVKINKNNSMLWDNYGVSFFALKKYEEAIECYTKAININKFKWAFYNRGNAFIKLNKVSEAKKDYNYAIKIDPNFSTSMVTLSRIFREEGNMDESKRYCRAAKPLINRETNYNKACFHAICDSTPDKALELLREVLDKKQQSKEYIKQDDDLKFICNDDRFIELIS